MIRTFYFPIGDFEPNVALLRRFKDEYRVLVDGEFGLRRVAGEFCAVCQRRTDQTRAGAGLTHMASITIRNLVKRYGNFTVIPDLSLEIADHEFVVFVGPSGCGKSTLLRIIAGLEPITAGELLIGERRVNGVPAAQRDIAMVFQDYALYPHMRVYENMSFALELRGIAKAEIDARVKARGGAAAYRALSRPSSRRSCRAASASASPWAAPSSVTRKVFLFDEPLSNLDAKLRGQVRAEIKALSQQLTTTMVFVTHDQIEAMTMADRIVVLQSGTVQQYDTPEVVYERPANQLCGRFYRLAGHEFLPRRVARRCCGICGRRHRRAARCGNADTVAGRRRRRRAGCAARTFRGSGRRVRRHCRAGQAC